MVAVMDRLGDAWRSLTKQGRTYRPKSYEELLAILEKDGLAQAVVRATIEQRDSSTTGRRSRAAMASTMGGVSTKIYKTGFSATTNIGDWVLFDQENENAISSDYGISHDQKRDGLALQNLITAEKFAAELASKFPQAEVTGPSDRMDHKTRLRMLKEASDNGIQPFEPGESRSYAVKISDI